MDFKRIFLILVLVLVIKGEIQKENSNRTKRTLNYFFEGLFSMLNAASSKKNLTSEARSEQESEARHHPHHHPLFHRHRQPSLMIPIATISRMSAYSNPGRSNHEDDSHQINNHYHQPIVHYPAPIPMAANQIEMTSSADSSKISLLDALKPVESHLSVSTVPNSIESTTSDDMTTEESTTIESEITPTTTIIPTTTTTTETIITIDSIGETSFKTESSEITSTTMIPDTESRNRNTSNEIGDDDDSDENPQPNNSISIPVSNRHTTQSFDGPLIIERNQNEIHTPSYYKGCSDFNCLDKAFKDIRPYLSPNDFATSSLLVVPIAVAIPNIDARSRVKLPDMNYDIYTWHRNQPILHLHQPHIQFYGARQ